MIEVVDGASRKPRCLEQTFYFQNQAVSGGDAGRKDGQLAGGAGSTR